MPKASATHVIPATRPSERPVKGHLVRMLGAYAATCQRHSASAALKTRRPQPSLPSQRAVAPDRDLSGATSRGLMVYRSLVLYVFLPIFSVST